MEKLILILLFLIIELMPDGLVGQGKSDLNFTESGIVLKTPTGDICGTLAIPEHPKRTPVVIIIAGSGPTDRDANSTLGIKTNSYKMLAAGLAKNGISSLRFDKRGIGESKASVTNEIDLRFDTYINDVIGWIALLKQDKRFSGIIILGHSEGSLIGMIAAEKGEVSKFISFAGAGRPIDLVLKEQLQKQLPPDLMEESNKIIDSLKAGFTVSKVNPVLLSLYRPSVQPYMISWLKYDPAREISKLKIPVLIIQGKTDIQVSTEDARLLSTAKPDAQLLLIDNMNHIMKESDSDLQKNYATYRNPDLPLKSGLVDEIAGFIKKR